MSYTLTCPDPDCATVFEHSADPKTLAQGGDLISCPDCGEEWEWDYDAEADTLTLVLSEEEVCEKCGEYIEVCECDDEGMALTDTENEEEDEE